MGDLRAERVLLAGATGFLGRHVCDALRKLGVPEESIAAPTRGQVDLLDIGAAEGMLRGSFGGAGPSVVINCAGFSGGLGANRRQPARFFYDNLAIGMNVIEGLRRADLARSCAVVQLGNMVVYPADAAQPYRETSLFQGRPDADIASYGVAKLALLQMMEAYRLEVGLRGVYVIPSNLYGPGDTFDPERSHVVGAMIRRFVEAADQGAAEVTCWGTGGPLRDFLYVKDAAEGVVAAARYAVGLTGEAPVEAVNLASGREISIRALAEGVARAAGYRGVIRWDAGKGDGVARRALAIDRARELLGWEPRAELAEALKATVEWYRAGAAGKPGH